RRRRLVFGDLLDAVGVGIGDEVVSVGLAVRAVAIVDPAGGVRRLVLTGRAVAVHAGQRHAALLVAAGQRIVDLVLQTEVAMPVRTTVRAVLALGVRRHRRFLRRRLVVGWGWAVGA